MTVVSANGIRAVWIAALVGSVMLVASVVLFLLADPIRILPFTGGRQEGANNALPLVVAFVMMVAIPFVLARLSGRDLWAARSALAALAGPVATVVFFMLLPRLFDSLLTLLTLGLGVVGAVAMRNPAPGSGGVAWRVVTVVATVALSVLLERATTRNPNPILELPIFVLPLLVLPLLALSDTLAAARRDA